MRTMEVVLKELSHWREGDHNRRQDVDGYHPIYLQKIRFLNFFGKTGQQTKLIWTNLF